MSWTRTSSGTAGNGNNAAALTPGLPAGWAPGDLHVLTVQTFGGTGARRPSLPSGWTSVGGDTGWANGTAYHAVYWRVAVAGDVAPTVTMTGAGVANDTQLSQIHGFRPTSTMHVPTLRVAGTPSTNASADNVGPITGITPTAGDLVLLSVGKTNDWNGTATLAGTLLAAQNESTTGNDAGSALLYQLSSAGGATGDLAVADNGATASLGLGFGVLVAFYERDTTPGIEIFVSPEIGNGDSTPWPTWTDITGPFRSLAWIYADRPDCSFDEAFHPAFSRWIFAVRAPAYILDAIAADSRVKSVIHRRATDEADLTAVFGTQIGAVPTAWRNAAQTLLETYGVDTSWVTASTTIGELFSKAIRTFGVAMVVHGKRRLNALALMAQNLDTTVGAIPTAYRDEMKDWLTSRGIDTTWITASTTVRQVVASLPGHFEVLHGLGQAMRFVGRNW